MKSYQLLKSEMEYQVNTYINQKRYISIRRGFYHKVKWEKHLSGTCPGAVRVSFAINCSMQKQQQSQLDQAQLGLIKPVRNESYEVHFKGLRCF